VTEYMEHNQLSCASSCTTVHKKLPRFTHTDIYIHTHTHTHTHIHLYINYRIHKIPILATSWDGWFKSIRHALFI